MRRVCLRDQVQAGPRYGSGPGATEGVWVVFKRLVQAGARAFLIAFLIAMPAVFLPGVTADGSQMIALLALVAALLTFVEYVGDYPSFIEFRDAPPFNRLRFVALFVTVLVLVLIWRQDVHPTRLGAALAGFGAGVGQLLDFPYSPVRLMVLATDKDMRPERVGMVRIGAGLCYLVSLIAVLSFVVTVRVLNWPIRNGAFNFWVNLPLFDPTAGADILYRLRRDAHVNVALGFLLPFVIPAVMELASEMIDPLSLANAQTMIWTMSAWAFLPASLIMRGAALGRIAGLIEEKRRRAHAQADLQAA